MTNICTSSGVPRITLTYSVAGQRSTATGDMRITATGKPIASPPSIEASAQTAGCSRRRAAGRRGLAQQSINSIIQRR
jgi:hypothetical protein